MTIPRRAILLAAMASLVVGALAGLGRLGLSTPLDWSATFESRAIVNHGALMVSGFLGTLIALERAVGLGWRPAYLAPACSALGTLLLLAGAPDLVGGGLMALGALGLAAIYLSLVRRPTAHFLLVMALGAVMWLVGNALFAADRPVFESAPWWGAFLVLTIAGERLELRRIARPSTTILAAFYVCAAVLVAGAVVSVGEYGAGIRLYGAGLIALALWLARYDAAWRVARSPGLPRYMAVGLLAGYVWLVIGGVAAVQAGAVYGGTEYDTVLHAVFLGFAISMVFAHGPIIFPAVTGINLAFTRAFYAPLLLLHISVAVRIAGNLQRDATVREWGGLLNAAALAAFIVTVLGSAVLARRRGSRRTR